MIKRLDSHLYYRSKNDVSRSTIISHFNKQLQRGATSMQTIN